MNQIKPQYHGYRFFPEIIGHAVWLYHRFCLSFRDVEDLLAERGIVVSYETIRSWCNKFGPAYARRVKKHRGSLGDTWYMDEVYIVTVSGERRYLWRAVDQESLPHERSECFGYGDVLDILVQNRKDKRAAVRFFKKLMKGQGRTARLIVTDKLPSYGAARKVIMPTSMHCHERYANNRAEVSHEHTRAQERQMRRFKSPGQAQRFLAVHSQVHNLFRIGRHLLRAANYRLLRNRSFETWQQVTCAC
jgi:putative transposase